VVTPDTMVDDVMNTLWRRGLIPSTYWKTHFMSIGRHGSLFGSESMGAIGVRPFSHLHLRVRCRGGTKGSGTKISHVDASFSLLFSLGV